MSVGFRQKFQSGLALVMVLWLVAAMSLLVASVVHVARMDVRQQQFSQTKVRASAVADKAMRLSMRQFVFDVTENSVPSQVAQQYTLEDSEFSGLIDIYPASGLIHLGSLTPNLLLAVLQYGVGIDEKKLEILSRVLESDFVSERGGDEKLGLPDKFRVLEDLLLVPGISVDAYEVLKDYFYVGQEGAAGINPVAAPRELLLVLAGGDVEAVEEFLALRNEARKSKDVDVVAHPEFLAELISKSDSSVYRVDVTLSSSRQSFEQRYWLMLAPSREGIPWTMQAKEPILVLALESPESDNK